MQQEVYMGFQISRLSTDAQKEVDGVWVDHPDGYSLLIARMPNLRYNDAVTKYLKPHRAKSFRGTLTSSLRDKAVIYAMARTILLGWRGIDDDQTPPQPIMYSSEKAEELLTKYPEFMNIVMGFAADVDNYKADLKEDDVGN